MTEGRTGRTGLVIVAFNKPGVLHQLTGVMADHGADIHSVSIIEEIAPDTRVYFELDLPGSPEALAGDLRKLEVARSVEIVQTLQKIYGKRIIIIGGGAQVGKWPLAPLQKLIVTTSGANISRSIPSPWLASRLCVCGARGAPFAASPGSGSRRFFNGWGDRNSSARSSSGGPARNQPEHGRQCSRSQRSGRHGPGSGRSNGGDGSSRYCQLYDRPAAPPRLLSSR